MINNCAFFCATCRIQLKAPKKIFFKRKNRCAKKTKFKLSTFLNDSTHVLHNSVLYFHVIHDVKRESGFPIKEVDAKNGRHINFFLKSGCDRKMDAKQAILSQF